MSHRLYRTVLDSAIERIYEPPLSEAGTEIDMANGSLLAPGVAGYAVQNGDEIWIPDVRAIQEGNGEVGKFLDSLSPRCCFVTVISKRLAGMLVRRGFIPEDRPSEDGDVDVWKRVAS